ncbi:MAG: type II secretion system protein GspF, partial [Massilia sp.]
MPAFRYEAVDNGGATRKGVVNADSPRAARADLRAQGLTPLSVEAIAA